MKISKLTVVSLVYDGILLVFSGWWLFNVDRTPYNRCLSIFWLPLLALIAVSMARTISKRGQAPVALGINLTVLGLLIGLIIFRAYWDLDFILYGKEYSSALRTINANEVDFSKQNGSSFVLPAPYSHLTRFGEISITHDKDNKTILVVFPETPDDLDGLMTAYIYVAGNKAVRVPEKCLSGRPVNPYHENWYYCVVSGNQVR